MLKMNPPVWLTHSSLTGNRGVKSEFYYSLKRSFDISSLPVLYSRNVEVLLFLAGGLKSKRAKTSLPPVHYTH